MELLRREESSMPFCCDLRDFPEELRRTEKRPSRCSRLDSESPPNGGLRSGVVCLFSEPSAMDFACDGGEGEGEEPLRLVRNFSLFGLADADFDRPFLFLCAPSFSFRLNDLDRLSTSFLVIDLLRILSFELDRFLSFELDRFLSRDLDRRRWLPDFRLLCDLCLCGFTLTCSWPRSSMTVIGFSTVGGDFALSSIILNEEKSADISPIAVNGFVTDLRFVGYLRGDKEFLRREEVSL